MKLDMQGYELIGLSLLAAVVLVQWLRTRKLETKIEQLTMSVLQLVNESEAATISLRKSLAQITVNQKSAQVEAALQTRNEPSNLDEMWNIDRRHRVMTLAKHGLNASEIARRLCLPDGEIQLMLNMSQQTVN
ncbi:MAG TPA: hypothetical protein VFC63_28980 [Blastocatellia bacterium]|nr:hypothetical protein [Blastocatellia bacterium]